MTEMNTIEISTDDYDRYIDITAKYTDQKERRAISHRKYFLCTKDEYYARQATWRKNNRDSFNATRRAKWDLNKTEANRKRREKYALNKKNNKD
jgi:hypothetical protein